MRWLLAFVIMAAPLLARDKQEVRHWQEGTLRSVEFELVLWQTVTVAEIATDKIMYRVSVVHRLDLAPGSKVKFAVSGAERSAN
jgi:hypothetical protein